MNLTDKILKILIGFAVIRCALAHQVNINEWAEKPEECGDNCKTFYPEIDVPCKFRLELYWPHMKQMVDFYTSVKLLREKSHKEMEKSVVWSYVSTGSYLEDLSLVLDQTFVAAFSSFIVGFDHCENVQRTIRNTFARELILKTTTVHQKLVIHEKIRETYFELLLEYIHVKNVNQDLIDSHDFICGKVSLEAARNNRKRNMWEVQAVMQKTWEEEATFFLNHIKSAIDHLRKDFALIHKIFFSDKKGVELENISYSLGDRHKSTGSVAILTFKYADEHPETQGNRLKLVYKPSTVLIDFVINGNTKEICSLSTKQSEEIAMKHTEKIVDPTVQKIADIAGQPASKSEEQPLVPEIEPKQLEYLSDLCRKLKGNQYKPEDRTSSSFVELLNELETDHSKHIYAYKILPIEYLEDKVPALEELPVKQEPDSEMEIEVPKNAALDDEKLKLLDKYMQKRMAYAHGYIEFLPSHFKQDVDLKNIEEKLQNTPPNNISSTLQKIFINAVHDNKLGFKEEKIAPYSYKVGKLVAIITLLSSTDLHWENAITCTKDNHEEPCVIDYENTLNPVNEMQSFKLAFKHENGGFTSKLITPSVKTNLYIYNARLLRMILLERITDTFCSRPIIVEYNETNELCFRKLDYDETMFNKGIDFVLTIFNEKGELSEANSNPTKASLLDWVNKPIMEEVIVREVPVSTKDLFNIVRDLKKTDKDASLSRLQTISIIGELLFTFSKEEVLPNYILLERDKALRNHIDLSKLPSEESMIEQSSNLIIDFAKLFNNNLSYIAALFNPLLDHLKIMREITKKFVDQISDFSDMLVLTQPFISNEAEEDKQFKKMQKRIEKLMKLKENPKEIDEINLDIEDFKVFMKDWAEISRIFKVYIDFKGQKELITEELKNLRKSNSFEEELPIDHEKSHKAVINSIENLLESPDIPKVSQSKANLFSGQPQTEEQAKALEIVRAVIPHVAYVRPSAEKQESSGSKSTETQEPFKSQSIILLSKNEKNQKLLKDSIEKFSKIDHVIAFRKNQLIEFKNYLDKNTDIKLYSLREMFSKISEGEIQSMEGKFERLQEKLDPISEKVVFAFKRYKNAWENQNMKVPKVIMSLEENLRDNITKKSSKDFVSIFHSDIIDMLMDGLVPAYYSLASGRYLYTPEGRSVISSSSKESSDYPKYKILDWLKAIREGPSTQVTTEFLSKIQGKDLQALEVLEKKMNERIEQRVPYYQTSPIQFIRNNFKKGNHQNWNIPKLSENIQPELKSII